MPEAPRLRSIEVDLATNSLRLVLSDRGGGEGSRTDRRAATIEVGTGGRLIGVELEDGYIDVMAPHPGTEHLIRSAPAEIAVETGEGSGAPVALVIPRAGSGYEITYPSGNQ
jgi:hypothetical protein